MRIDVATKSETYFGLSVQLSQADIELLINQLNGLSKASDQHFHLSTSEGDYFVDIEVSAMGKDQESNAACSGFAIEPKTNRDA